MASQHLQIEVNSSRSGRLCVTIGAAEVHVPAEAAAKAYLEKWLGAPTALFGEVMVANKETPPELGAYWQGQGGVYAGTMRGEDGKPDYYLIVASGADGLGDYADLQWGGRGHEEPGAKSTGDGHANTLALRTSDMSHPAAHAMSDLTIEGHQDFYLPSQRELALCWATVPDLFEKTWYWSSTQHASGSDYAWCQNFDNGSQSYDNTNYKGRARAVRRLTI